MKKVNKQPVITIESAGKPTRVKFLGIDISKALTKISYSADGIDSFVEMKIDNMRLLDILCDINEEDIKKAQSILAPYKESRAHFNEIIL